MTDNPSRAPNPLIKRVARAICRSEWAQANKEAKVLALSLGTFAEWYADYGYSYVPMARAAVAAGPRGRGCGPVRPWMRA